jgi:hypothetical protein
VASDSVPRHQHATMLPALLNSAVVVVSKSSGGVEKPQTNVRRALPTERHAYLQGGGAVTDLQQQLGHAELATTQIYASALSARRRAAVMALDFGDAASQRSKTE